MIRRIAVCYVAMAAILFILAEVRSLDEPDEQVGQQLADMAIQ